MTDEYFQKIDSPFQQLLTNLNLNECKELQRWLRARIKYLADIPHPDKKIKDLNLSVRSNNAFLIMTCSPLAMFYDWRALVGQPEKCGHKDSQCY